MPIFIGGEGKSEAGYGALLGRLAQEAPVAHIAIRSEILQPGAGDCHQLVLSAIKKIREIERARVPFAIKALLLDPGTPSKIDLAIAEARAAGIDYLIWQDPDHEALLLRHLPGCAQLRPPIGTSLQALQNHWPGYAKGQSAQQLSVRIDRNSLARVAAVEPTLRQFFTAIGLI